MSTVKETANTVKLARLIWLFMFVVLITAPLFPGRDTFGFYAVEWSFYFFAFFFMFFILTSGMMGDFTPRWDNIYYLIIIYWVLGFISLVDAENKVRGILFWGQYIPEFFMMILCVSLIRSEDSLDNIINKLTYLSFFFCIIVIVVFAIYPERRVFSDFLLNKFNIDSCKILTYIELPLCVVIYRMFTGYRSKFNVMVFFLALIDIVISGSRGSILVLIGILGLALLKTKSFGKAFLMGGLTVLILVAALLISPYTAERFNSLLGSQETTKRQDEESISRLYTGMVAYQTLVDHLYNGVGMGNLSQYSEIALNKINIPSEVREYWKRTKIFDTTCTPLKMGAEIGIIGFFFFFVWYFTLWRRIKIAQKNNKRGKALQTLTGLEIYVIASFVHNFVDVGFYNYYVWVYYGIVIAATQIYNGREVPKTIFGHR